MPYLDKDFKPSLFEYTNVNDYNRLLVYYPAKAKRRGLDCDFTYEILVTPTPTPTSSSTATPTPTLTSTPTPTPTTSTPSLDPDAAAYLADVVASGGTTDATIESAVDTLFTSLKSAGLYSKMLAMWPFVGSTASSHSINALLNKSFDITWYGGMTHDVSGSTGNGSNGYGDLNFSKDDFTAYNDYSFGIYQSSLSSGTGVSIGSYNVNSRFQIGPNVSGNYFMRSNNNTSLQASNGGNILGNYIAIRNTSNQVSLSRNGTAVLTGSNTPETAANTRTFYIFTFNLNDTPYDYGDERLSFTFMGQSLSTSEITTLDNIINTFQTSLGRNTY